MKVLFAMDLIDQKAVRLVKGDFAKMKVYGDDPLARIEEMQRRGARDFHIIDLDGARTGEPVHADLITRIRERVKGYMEVGGGIRTEERISFYRGIGVDGVIVGTRALVDPFFLDSLASPGSLILGLDMDQGKPMAKGWKEAVESDAATILERAERARVKAVLYTSISRDGTLSGPDFEGIAQMETITRLPIIASGGVTTTEDLGRLRSMGVWAAIVGKALYEGLIAVEEANRYAD